MNNQYLLYQVKWVPCDASLRGIKSLYRNILTRLVAAREGKDWVREELRLSSSLAQSFSSLAATSHVDMFHVYKLSIPLKEASQCTHFTS